MRSRMILVAIALAVAAAVAWWVARQLSIDGCLDRGGRWDYERSLCDEP